MVSKRSYSISELAQELDITTRTIRFYEEKGLLSPERKGRQRIYFDADRVRLKLILRGKRIGLSLEESCEVIDMYDPEHGNRDQYHTLLEKIALRRRQFQQQIKDINYALRDLDDVADKLRAAMSGVEAKSKRKNEDQKR